MPDSIRALADAYFDHLCSVEPSSAHLRGDVRFADRFEDLSREAEEQLITDLRAFIAEVRRFDPVTLDDDDRVTWETLIYDAETRADLAQMHLTELAVDPIFGLQVSVPLVVPRMGVPTPEVADAMVDKLRGIARAYDQLSDRLRQGVAAGRVPARFAVDGVVAQLDTALAGPVADDPLLSLTPPPSFDETTTARWKDRIAAVIADEIRPAMARHRETIAVEVAPSARPDDQAGLAWIPDGDVAYARAVRRHTTLPIDPSEIHEIGRLQTERLAEEYREIAGAVLDTTDLPEIFRRLREDPALHHTSGDAVIAAAERAFAKARAAMGEWFGRLPRANCIVEATTTGAVAFYFPPATDGSRPGTFFMNVADPGSWATYEIEATAFHEGIPGHHLQIAIAQELGDAVPAFRRHAYIAAYSEGWGLYTERLADEMGLYGSPLDRVGMLSADSMRAGRLVVDTGVHALGWSRERAIEHLLENSPMTRRSVVDEIDRYLTRPGQAVSYMIGRLEIQRMRAEAERRLGGRFDVRGFHDVVLGSGEVPLETLERLVAGWAGG